MIVATAIVVTVTTVDAIDKQQDEACRAIDNAESVVWRRGFKHYMPLALDDGTILNGTAEYTRSREQARLGALDRAGTRRWPRLPRSPRRGLVGIAVKARLIILEPEMGASDYGQDIAQSLAANLDRLAPGSGMERLRRYVAWKQPAG